MDEFDIFGSEKQNSFLIIHLHVILCMYFRFINFIVL